MNNFSFSNPVKIIFGKDTIKELSHEIPHSSKVLVIYGGGSIKKNGVYEQVSKALTGYDWIEFSGIEANPHYETCLKAVALIKKEKVNYILAVGGGSVIDATKFIAAASCLQGQDAWDILAKGIEIKEALPFGTVLTISATGSEMNDGGVISRAATDEKLPFSSPLVFPRFSVLDPTVTYSLPPRQVANGVVDAFVHVVEQYLTYNEGSSPLQDRMSEAILKTIVEEGSKVLNNPTDYDVRANLMWASTWALNYWISCGVPQDWATHMMGHEITALFGLDHAQTLAVVLPGVMDKMREQKSKKIQQLGREVFNLTAQTEKELIDSTIESVIKFFESLNVNTRFSQYNLGNEVAEKVSKRMQERGWKLGEQSNITSDMVSAILKSRI